MKIVFTGGGSGGHFYPIVAVVQKVNQIINKEKILDNKMYYFSNDPYDREVLFENNLTYQYIPAGKMRLYFSFKNFLDLIKTSLGIFTAIFKLFMIYPDVVFGKGGYASFPTLFAARFLGIPVIIHESDSYPGRVNIWAGKFAKRIALSFTDASIYFPKNEKVAWIGQPIRIEIENKATKENAFKYFNFESNKPVIFVIGGSQGAELINDTLIDILPVLLEKYIIIHQSGINNFTKMKARTSIVLENSKNKTDYLLFPFLNNIQMKNAAGAADIVISRAGSSLFEIASWNIPSILIPITKSNGNHQIKNAFAYARAGCCSVIEEINLTPHILSAEIDRFIEDKNLYESMKKNTENFYKKDAGLKIAEEIISIALSHEK